MERWKDGWTDNLKTQYSSIPLLHLYAYCIFSVVVFFGCQPVLYRESWPVPPPERAELPPVPSDQCSVNCASIARALELKHEIDRGKALKKIARRKDLTKHDQLHLIEMTLSLEMFGADKVFMELAKNPYLRITARQYLLNYTDRLEHSLREDVLQQLMKNQGVPDDLTPMEKFAATYFNLTINKILDYHRRGYQAEEIITIFYLARIDQREDYLIAHWYEPKAKSDLQRLWWQEIIEKKLKLSPDILRIKLTENVQFPKKFQRLAQFYQNDSRVQPLTDEEITCLVQLKMLNSYYGVSPDKILNEIAKERTFDDLVQQLKR